MFRHGEISTEIDRKPFVFTLAAAVCCLTAAVLLFVLGGGNALAVFSGILVSVVAAVSLFILFVMLTDRAYIDGGVLNTRYLFKKRSIPLADIGKITCKENVYSVYDKRGGVVATVNGLLTGIDRIVSELDKNGVRFE